MAKILLKSCRCKALRGTVRETTWIQVSRGAAGIQADAKEHQPQFWADKTGAARGFLLQTVSRTFLQKCVYKEPGENGKGNMSACWTANSSRYKLKKYSSEGPGLSACTRQEWNYKKLPSTQNKRGRRRLSCPSFNSFHWPRWLIDSRTLKKYTWTWSTSAWHGPMKKASQNQPKSIRIWCNRTLWCWRSSRDGTGEPFKTLMVEEKYLLITVRYTGREA